MTFALGRHLVESTTFTLLVGVFALAMRKRRAATRHTLWFIAVIKFALPVALFSALGSKLHNFLPLSRLTVSVPEGLSNFLNHPAKAMQLTSASSSAFHPLIVVWLAGSGMMLLVWLPKLFVPLGPLDSIGHLADSSLLHLKARIGLRRDVKLRFAQSNEEPALKGFWRPVVTIPGGLSATLSESELEAVVLHELAHAKRADNWTSAFAHAVVSIFWFYPLLWWIERRLFSERERACDEMVVRAGVAPEDYVAGILKVCRFHVNNRVAGVSAVSGSKFKNRMEAIMSLSASTQVARTPKAVVVALISTMTIIPLAISLILPTHANGQSASGNQQANKQTNSESALSCVFAGVQYPEGTVIQEEGGPEQMCARVLNPVEASKTNAPKFTAQWIHTSSAIRERSKNIIRLSQPPPGPTVCKPKSSAQNNLCSCEEGGSYSQNSLVDSSNGKLSCNEGKWVPIHTTHVERN
jgi:beta-lactamase regulating signal transducer with metallopeptidase domain